MEHLDFMDAVWGGIVTTFTFLGKKILKDYDVKIIQMQEGDARIMAMLMDLDRKVTRIETIIEHLRSKKNV